jgi:hypothetical protein
MENGGAGSGRIALGDHGVDFEQVLLAKRYLKFKDGFD